jgi:hypothetical protein
MTVYDIGIGSSITVFGSAVKISYQPASANSVWITNPSNSMLGPLAFTGPQPEPVELNLLDVILSSIPIQSNEYGECVRENRADPAAALIALGSSVPKRIVPPFRVPYPSQPYTTPASVGAHYIRGISPRAAGALRAGGRAVSKLATPLTMAEGIFDWGVLAYCGF